MRLLRAGGVALVSVVALVGLGYGAAFAAYWRDLRRSACRIVPLMYHAVVPDDRVPGRYAIRESVFARQLDSLKAAGAVTPPLDSVSQWLRQPDGTCRFPPRSVIITFDLDGESWHLDLAVPHLAHNGFTAVFFVPLMALDHPPDVTSAEVTGLAGAGMTIGSHTEHHYDMRYEVPDSMIASLQRTRDRLAALSGQPILTVSAPGGRYDDRVVEGVVKAGFTTFFTSDPCYLVPGMPSEKLCRIEIRGDGGMTAVDALRRPALVARQAVAWRSKRALESAVGPRLWNLLHLYRDAFNR